MYGQINYKNPPRLGDITTPTDAQVIMSLDKAVNYSVIHRLIYDKVLSKVSSNRLNGKCTTDKCEVFSATFLKKKNNIQAVLCEATEFKTFKTVALYKKFGIPIFKTKNKLDVKFKPLVGAVMLNCEPYP